MASTTGFLPVLCVVPASGRDLFASYWAASLDELGYRGAQRAIHLSEAEVPRGYCTASWALALEREIGEIAGYVAAHSGEHVICAGPDVQFFEPFPAAQHRWRERMDKDSLDLLFACAPPGDAVLGTPPQAGTGFFVMRCSDRTLMFWQQVLNSKLAEPKMASYAPRTVQYLVNELLMYRDGGGPQDGDFGIRWDFIPDTDGIWSEPQQAQDVSMAAFHHAAGVSDKRLSLQQVKAAVQTRHELGTCGAAELAARQQFADEVDRVTSEIASLRRQLEHAAPAEFDRHRARMAMASSELLAEVQALVDHAGIGHLDEKLSTVDQTRAPATFDIVD